MQRTVPGALLYVCYTTGVDTRLSQLAVGNARSLESKVSDVGAVSAVRAVSALGAVVSVGAVSVVGAVSARLSVKGEYYQLGELHQVVN